MTDPPRTRLSAASGVVIGFLSIGAMDGWPFGPDLETKKAALGLYTQDAVVLLLIVVLVLLSSRTLFRGLLDGRASRAVLWWAMLLLGWWLYTLLRTYVDTQVPSRHAIFFGRDFAYYPLLTVFMADALKDRRLRHWALGTFVGFALLDGVLQTLVAVGHGGLDHLIHAQTLTPSGGFTRVYASASDAVLVALFICLGLVLLARNGWLRRWMLLGLVVAVVSVLAELTRAKYLGASAGIVGAALFWFVPGGEHRRRGARGLLATLVVAAAVAVALFGAGPTVLGHAGQSIAHKLGSTITTALSPSAAGSTTLVRENELAGVEQIIGSHAALGLGFLDPRNVYYAQIRGGSIRNSDLGLFNVVATMGIVGTVIYYLALIGVALALICQHARRRVPIGDQWLGFAVLGWVIAIAASSLTLVTLFSPTGVVSAGLMLGCGVALLDPERQPITAPLPRSVRAWRPAARPRVRGHVVPGARATFRTSSARRD